MEGDAGTSRLNPPIDTDPGGQERSDPGIEPDPAGPEQSEAPEMTPVDEPTDPRRPSRLGTGSVVALALAFVLLTAGAVAGGYFALKANEKGAAIARSDEAALAAAKECVAATQAPDTAAMTAAQSKILECSTGDFGVQAGLFSSVVAEAYQAANAQVAVDDLRAAMERHNDDGSITVLVAVRVKITNSEAANQQVGYRLRATMAFDEGRYRIAKLDQVTS
jgi:Mce-associated membrane protein